MNFLHPHILQKANEEAIYNLYVYLSHKSDPIIGKSFSSLILDLEASLKNQSSDFWNSRDIYRLSLLKNAVKDSSSLAHSRLGDLIRIPKGLTGCSFIKPDGSASVVFRGTGSGEWIDNGEGLSGISEENTYITYKKGGTEAYRITVSDDYATDQQVEALNWFLSICAKNNWSERTFITLSGHSKGGNKAQFVTIHSDLVKECYSFDGQGFSPEALSSLKNRYGEKFESRRQIIKSLSAENDYVNVLGERLATPEHIYYFKSQGGLHYLEAMLDKSGRFHSQCNQGNLSKYIETVSKELMSLPPSIRKYASLGVMNIFQKYLGKDTALGGDRVSFEKTVAGLTIAVASLLSNLPKRE